MRVGVFPAARATPITNSLIIVLTHVSISAQLLRIILRIIMSVFLPAQVENSLILQLELENALHFALLAYSAIHFRVDVWPIVL